MKQQYYSLDLLKFCASVCIIWHHFQLDTGTVFESGINFGGGKFYFGYLVELFFMISGFLTVHKMQRDKESTFSQFIYRKFIRIYPMAMISVLGYSILAWIYYKKVGSWYMNINLNAFRILTSLMLIFVGGGLNVGLGINNPIWYLCVLIICYILYWLILWEAKRLNITPVYLFGAVIFVGAGIITYNINLPFLNNAAARGYIGFFIGIIVYYLIQRVDGRILKITACIFMSYSIYTAVINYDEMWEYTQFILCFIVYPAVIILLITTSISNILVNKKCFSILGKISFEMYLWHFPIELLSVFIRREMGYWAGYTRIDMIIQLFIVVSWSTLIYWGIERPLYTWICNRCHKPINSSGDS